METKTKELPKWFNGEHYSEGADVTNPFSGESFYLDRTELSMYDFIMGCSITFEQGGLFTDCDPKLVRDFDKGRDWFRKTNIKAYMALLD
tara:strand:+ start:146 stop:415 length:270 start_codon:yes stop_codon:yes gene_type:complete